MVDPREGGSLTLDEINSLAINENSACHGLILGLLPQATAGCEQDAGQKYPSSRGAHASEEVTLRGATRSGGATLPGPAPRMPEIPQLSMSGGLAPLTLDILYEER
jgi:hypothetical protein